MHSISKKLEAHYSKKFAAFGPTPLGVDWGAVESDTHLRYAQMLQVLQNDSAVKPSLLDVGCGYGGLYVYAQDNHIDLTYTGIDVAKNMVTWSQQNIDSRATFLVGDILEHDYNQDFDYVVCNGVLTQKLDATAAEMESFSKELIQKMFAAAKHGVAFNMMTSHVNYTVDNLFYKNPSELTDWCLQNITSLLQINHAYPLYEFTTYLYRGER